MTWLKKKIREMGLFRRGINVNYTPLVTLKATVQVYYLFTNDKKCDIIYVGGDKIGPNCNIGYRQMRILQDK